MHLQRPDRTNSLNAYTQQFQDEADKAAAIIEGVVDEIFDGDNPNVVVGRLQTLAKLAEVIGSANPSELATFLARMGNTPRPGLAGAPVGRPSLALGSGTIQEPVLDKAFAENDEVGDEEQRKLASIIDKLNQPGGYNIFGTSDNLKLGRLDNRGLPIRNPRGGNDPSGNQPPAHNPPQNTGGNQNPPPPAPVQPQTPPPPATTQATAQVPTPPAPVGTTNPAPAPAPQRRVGGLRGRPNQP